MIQNEFREICQTPREEEFNYPHIDRSKKKDQGRYCVCTESNRI